MLDYQNLKIKGAKIMTPGQMVKQNAAMVGKFIVAGWHYPYTIDIYVNISVNQSKIEQTAKHDEYAGYMPDFDFEVKDGEGKKTYLDGHIGTKYFVFEDLESARKAVKLLTELDETERFESEIAHQQNVLEGMRVGERVGASVIGWFNTLKVDYDILLKHIDTKKKELIKQLNK